MYTHPKILGLVLDPKFTTNTLITLQPKQPKLYQHPKSSFWPNDANIYIQWNIFSVISIFTAVNVHPSKSASSICIHKKCTIVGSQNKIEN